MTTTRDPLAVLRELLEFEERCAEYEPRANYEGREAIAQVEALAASANRLDLSFQAIGNHPGPVSNTSLHMESERALIAMHEALRPFAPGQDSEGGGNG